MIKSNFNPDSATEDELFEEFAVRSHCTGLVIKALAGDEDDVVKMTADTLASLASLAAEMGEIPTLIYERYRDRYPTIESALNEMMARMDNQPESENWRQMTAALLRLGAGAAGKPPA